VRVAPQVTACEDFAATRTRSPKLFVVAGTIVAPFKACFSRFSIFGFEFLMLFVQYFELIRTFWSVGAVVAVSLHRWPQGCLGVRSCPLTKDGLSTSAANVLLRMMQPMFMAKVLLLLLLQRGS
jgi:hypothetical protein